MTAASRPSAMGAGAERVPAAPHGRCRQVSRSGALSPFPDTGSSFAQALSPDGKTCALALAPGFRCTTPSAASRSPSWWDTAGLPSRWRSRRTGGLLASGMRDTTVLLWDVREGGCAGLVAVAGRVVRRARAGRELTACPTRPCNCSGACCCRPGSPSRRWCGVGPQAERSELQGARAGHGGPEPVAGADAECWSAAGAEGAAHRGERRRIERILPSLAKVARQGERLDARGVHLALDVLAALPRAEVEALLAVTCPWPGGNAPWRRRLG